MEVTAISQVKANPELDGRKAMTTQFAETPKGAFAEPDRILVATNLTDAGTLLPHIFAQAEASHANVTLVHAITPPETVPVQSGVIPYASFRRIDGETEQAVLDMGREIESRGIACDIIVKNGSPAEVILEAVRETGATRLIMGTHGHRKLAQLMLGSVANEVMRTAGIPVFAAGPLSKVSGDHSRPRTILHPVSFLGNYRHSFDFALQLAQLYGAKLTLLHVLGQQPTDTVIEHKIAWGNNALAALVPDQSGLAEPVETCALYGDLVEGILSTARIHEADWIVMGLDGEPSGLSFQNSAAYQVLCHAECPVITLPHPAHRKAKKRLHDVLFDPVVV
jgi:nucleotide-binding universal stress UspA family protein